MASNVMMKKYFPIFSLLIGLSACQHYYPMGMSKSEWQELTPIERAEMRSKQATLNAAHDAALAEREAKEKSRIEKMYADARPGDVVQCVVEGGKVTIGTKDLEYRPFAFRLARGERKYVEIQGSKLGNQNSKLWVKFRQDGLGVSLCSTNPTNYQASGCVNAVAVSRDLAKGKSWMLDVKERIKGATMRCALPLDRGSITKPKTSS